jgi:signal peptidase I
MTSLLMKLKSGVIDDCIYKIECKYAAFKYDVLKYKLFYFAVVPFILMGLFIFKVAFVSGSSMMPTYDGKEILGINMTVSQSDIRYGDRLAFDCADAELDKSNCVKRVIAKAGDRVMIRDSVVYLNGTPLKRRQLTGAEVREKLSNAEIGKFHAVLSRAVTLTMYEETLPNGELYTIQVTTHPEGYLPLLKQAKTLDMKVYDDLNTNYRGVIASLNMQEVLLKQNEYFMMGDNRGFSADSVDMGNIKWDAVKGRVVELGLRLPW